MKLLKLCIERKMQMVKGIGMKSECMQLRSRNFKVCNLKLIVCDLVENESKRPSN